MSNKQNLIIPQSGKTWMKPGIEVLDIKKDTFAGTGAAPEGNSKASKKYP